MKIKVDLLDQWWPIKHLQIRALQNHPIENGGTGQEIWVIRLKTSMEGVVILFCFTT